MLGGLQESTSYMTTNEMALAVLGYKGCFSIGDLQSASVTIPAEQKGGRCAILIVGCNTYTPSIFMLSRTAVAGTIFDGNIKASAITLNNDGSITVVKTVGLSLYYRIIVMEF